MKSFEKFPSNEEEKTIPKITKEDARFLDMDVNNPELLQWMKEKNIEFD